MERVAFNDIKTRFGDHASWAYWALPRPGKNRKDQIGDLSIFSPVDDRELLSTLHVRYAIIGLNYSRALDPSNVAFRNFHDDGRYGRDYRLRYALHGTRLWGAYMTDFLVDWVDPRAVRTMSQARANPGEVDRQAASREAELDAIGAQDSTLVALGNDAFALIQRYLPKRQIIKLPHYSAYIKLETYRATVAETLRAIED